MGVDIPHPLVVLAEAGGQHEARTELVHARNLIGKGHPLRDALRKFVHQELGTWTLRSMKGASIARAPSFDESVFLEKMRAFVAPRLR